MAGKLDDVINGQEILGNVQLFDHRQFLVQHGTDFIGQPFGITPVSAGPSQFGQVFLRRAPGGNAFLRVFIGQFAQIKGAGIGHSPRRSDCMRPVAEQQDHLGGRFQMAFGIGSQQKPCPRDGGLVQNAGHHIVQRAAFGGVILHVIGGQDRQAGTPRQPVQPVDAGAVIAAIKIAGRDMAQGGQGLGQAGQTHAKCVKVIGGKGYQLHPFGMGRQIIQRDIARAFGLPLAVHVVHLALGQQLTQPSIGCATAGIGQKCLTRHQLHPAADDRAQLRL